jgi:hypothetical protein
VILNEHSTIIADLWDSTNRRRSVGLLMRQWDELIQIASTLVLTDNEDEIIWQHTSGGVYCTTRNLYIGPSVSGSGGVCRQIRGGGGGG